MGAVGWIRFVRAIAIVTGVVGIAAAVLALLRGLDVFDLRLVNTGPRVESSTVSIWIVAIGAWFVAALGLVLAAAVDARGFERVRGWGDAAATMAVRVAFCALAAVVAVPCNRGAWPWGCALIVPGAVVMSALWVESWSWSAWSQRLRDFGTAIVIFAVLLLPAALWIVIPAPDWKWLGGVVGCVLVGSVAVWTVERWRTAGHFIGSTGLPRRDGIGFAAGLIAAVAICAVFGGLNVVGLSERNSLVTAYSDVEPEPGSDGGAGFSAALAPDGTLYSVGDHGYRGYGELPGPLTAGYCAPSDCSDRSLIEIPVDYTEYASVTPTSEGFAAVMFNETADFSVVTCDRKACATPIRIPIVRDSKRYPGPQIAEGPDKSLIVTYSALHVIRVVRIDNPASASPTVGSVDLKSTVADPTDPAVAVSPQGLPVLSYVDGKDGSLYVATCDDKACKGSVTHNVVGAPPTNRGHSVSMVVDSEGVPMITAVDPDHDDLALLICDSPSCEKVTSRQISSDAHYRYAKVFLSAADKPVLAQWKWHAPFVSVTECIEKRCGA